MSRDSQAAGLLRGGAPVSDTAMEGPAGLRLGRVADTAQSGGPCSSPSCLAGRACSIYRAQGACVQGVGGSHSAFFVGV